jgi:poly-gamma-glutamate system protein
MNALWSRRKRGILLLALALVWAAVFWAASGGRSVQTAYYGVQLDAASRMRACMDAVKAYKADRGIAPDAQDFHGTGMIGEDFNEITTTLGRGGKGTTANPDMAALVLRMLREAGVGAGDTVGAGFSGSFPAMNLAVITACEAMGVKLVYIASVGASTYGANNPELTFPEMAHLLAQDGLIAADCAAVTLGGADDAGSGMDPDMLSAIGARLAQTGLTVWRIPDYAQNIEARRGLYRDAGICCFVAVGGNITSMGTGADAVSLGQGVLLPDRYVYADEKSGLVQRYLADGLPVINLLNIKKLTADYGMPYDPAVWPQTGTGAVYTETAFPRPLIAACLAAAATLLFSLRLFCGKTAA